MSNKIICFTDNLGSGGAQRQLVGLACMLKERGYDVSVVLYHDNPFYKPLLDEAGIVATVVKSSNHMGRIWSLYRYFKRNQDSTIIAYQETPSLISALLRPFVKYSKLIVSERNTTQILAIKDKIRFWLYRFADYIVPNSYSQAEFIKSHFSKLSSKTKCITNFVDTDYFKPIHRPDFANTRTNTIVVVGSNKPQKNFHRFVNSIKILADKGLKFQVNWFGIYSAYIKEFTEYVEEQGVGSIVNVYEPTANIGEIYQASDFFCLPSLFEGFPNVLCEAISCGLPVTCSNVCDNPYIMDQIGSELVFDPLNIADMADKLERLILLSDEEWTANSISNRKCAEDIFSKKSFIDKYCDLL